LIADFPEGIIRVAIEDGIRVVGLLVLKLVTVGRYRSEGRSTLLVEGAVGLLAIAAGSLAVLMWLTR
jgi:hypothetical protein